MQLLTITPQVLLKMMLLPLVVVAPNGPEYVSLGSRLRFHIGKALFQPVHALMCTTQEFILSAANDNRVISPTLWRCQCQCRCIFIHMLCGVPSFISRDLHPNASWHV